MTKKIIFDFFGGGQNSLFNTIKEFNLENEYDVYTFDITPPQHNKQFYLDLSQEISFIIAELEKLPKPDIITASPLCQSFSCILSMKGGGTCFWKLNEDKTLLVERSKEEFNKLKSGFTGKLDADKQLEIKLLGEKCINNTINLINHFKPKYWYVENPASSLMWKYILLNKKDWFNESKKYLNQANYGQYGFVINKPTIFLSNVEMDLKKQRIPKSWYLETDENGVKWAVIKDKPHLKMKYFNGRSFLIAGLNQLINKENYVNYGANKKYSESGPASAIPHKLIKHILTYFV